MKDIVLAVDSFAVSASHGDPHCWLLLILPIQSPNVHDLGHAGAASSQIVYRCWRGDFELTEGKRLAAAAFESGGLSPVDRRKG